MPGGRGDGEGLGVGHHEAHPRGTMQTSVCVSGPLWSWAANHVALGPAFPVRQPPFS